MLKPRGVVSTRWRLDHTTYWSNSYSMIYHKSHGKSVTSTMRRRWHCLVNSKPRGRGKPWAVYQRVDTMNIATINLVKARLGRLQHIYDSARSSRRSAFRTVFCLTTVSSGCPKPPYINDNIVVFIKVWRSHVIEVYMLLSPEPRMSPFKAAVPWSNHSRPVH